MRQAVHFSPRERLETVFSGEEADRTPILGGWIACPEHICALAEVSIDEYWADPIKASIQAYEVLGSDGLIDICVPKSVSDFRVVDEHSYWRGKSALSLEEAVAEIDSMPSPEEIEADFDFDSAYESFKDELLRMQSLCGDMVWMPAQWKAGAKVTWFEEFGYETFFYIVGLYPDRAEKLMKIGGARGRCQSRLAARAVEEGLYPHAVLLGEGHLLTKRTHDFAQVFRAALCPTVELRFATVIRRGLQAGMAFGRGRSHASRYAN